MEKVIDLKSTELYIPIWLYSNLTLTSWIISMPTLHSNLVIFKCMPRTTPQGEFPTLHSNLVIFKCTRFGMFSKFHQCFTFQSGYIQILSPYSIENNPICFTFQSGYIQMVDRWRPKKNGRTFTFQSGYIQMIVANIVDYITAISLHSNLVIFKCRPTCLRCGRCVPLHSNLVIFK